MCARSFKSQRSRQPAYYVSAGCHEALTNDAAFFHF